jgi:hypothetical protein
MIFFDFWLFTNKKQIRQNFTEKGGQPLASKAFHPA